MISVTIYHGEKDDAYESLLKDLNDLQALVPHQLVTIDVQQQRVFQDKIGTDLPVVEVGPYLRRPPFNRTDLKVLLTAAQDRANQLERVDESGYQQRYTNARTISSSDRLSLWISKHYLAMVSVFLLLYVGLPFLAPVLMRSGVELPARVIYRVYGAMCHQLAFRSYFLFGEQPYYPREISGIEGVLTYEQVTNAADVDLVAARQFVGNETLGYKVALCERDVAIYGFMLLFGLFFGIIGRRLRPISWMAWLAVGLIPIGVDGFSQLISSIPFLANIVTRESTPLLRTITGGLFGWMTAWYLFPLLEETARETKRIVQRKMALVAQAPTADSER